MPDPSRSGEEVETLRDYRDIELWKDVTEAQWNDWRWQVANRITTVEVLRGVIPLSDPEAREIQESLGALRMAITPYYASLIDPKDPEDPVRRQAVPSILETHVAETDLRDPLHEDVDSPVPGLTHSYPDRGILLRLIPDPERPWNSEDLERLEGELLETLRGQPFPFVAMYWRRRPRHLTVLFHAPGEEKGPFLEALSHLCRVHREFDLLMGIGESKEDLDCIAESYEEAQVALDLSRHREFRSPVTSFRDVAVLHLLGGANDRGELQRFCSGTIRPLAEYDRANRSQLVLTLRTYLRDRNKNRTAQVLFIHRQTLAYRLRKIREITHRDLEDPDDLLALQLGLLADSLLSR